MRSRIADNDDGVPVYGHGWWTWQRWDRGAEHAVHMRRRGGPDGPDPQAAEEVLLDEPERARGRAYYEVGSMAVSPDGRWLAWTEDTTGRRIHALHIRNLDTGELLPRRIEGVIEPLAWASDNRTLFYIRQDPVTLQGDAVFRHRIDGGRAADVQVYEERDKTLSLDLRRSASGRFVVIHVGGYQTSETRAVPSQRPQERPRVVLARRPGVLHSADHLDGRWVILTNERAMNYRLVEAPEAAPDRRAGWTTRVPARPDASIEDFALLHAAIAIQERVGADSRVRLLPRHGGAAAAAAVMGEPASSTTLGDVHDPAASFVHVHTTSMVAPESTWALHVASGRRTLQQQRLVPGYDPALYRTARVWAPSHDGARVPVTLAWRADRAAQDGTAPLLIDGYGAYGASNDPVFSSPRVSLLDRGFIVALAHVRGGGELGPAWYEAGRLLNKKNSFLDFIAVTDHLVSEKWGAADKVFASGGSAGGLLMGVVANQAGDRFRGIALHVPFVDAVTTMLDASIPLVTNEWSQWGDPRRARDYRYLLSYSPYDQIAAKAYPAMLVTSGLWDSQVQYYEPAKYVARLRAVKTDRQPLLFHIDLQAGHGGRSGRFEQLDDAAREFAFFLALAGRLP
jgi:oligopeptidase B